jgi:hypothetical protein
MGIFRFDRNSGPTRDRTGGYMIGRIGEKHSGPGGEIVLVEYSEAICLRDEREGIRNPLHRVQGQAEGL